MIYSERLLAERRGFFYSCGSATAALEKVGGNYGVPLSMSGKKALGNWRDSGMTRNPSVENDAKLIVLTKINKYFREKVFY